MTSRQYKRIEEIITQAEDVTLEHPLLTPQGRAIQAAIRDLLVKVAAEQARAQRRESGEPIPGED